MRRFNSDLIFTARLIETFTAKPLSKFVETMNYLENDELENLSKFLNKVVSNAENILSSRNTAKDEKYLGDETRKLIDLKKYLSSKEHTIL